MTEAGFVPGRECGTCTVCCYALPIDSDELQKLPGEVCTNCTGRGCRIYETRPRTCRGFYCGWWLLPQLDEDWRPDKSGVLITPQNENIPERFALREGIESMILAGEDVVRRPASGRQSCISSSRRSRLHRDPGTGRLLRDAHSPERRAQRKRRRERWQRCSRNPASHTRRLECASI